MNAVHLILDYVEICEKRQELLDFAEFIPLWIVATEIAEDTPEKDWDLFLSLFLPGPRQAS